MQMQRRPKSCNSRPNGSSWNFHGKMDARAIVQNWAGMSARPEFYSGRGTVSSDLNSEHLEQIYAGVLENVGQEAATEFACLVRDIKSLNATAFLIALYGLERNGWKWNKPLDTDSKGIDVGPDMGDGVREAIGMATIGGYLSQSEDQTESLRYPFLRNHAKEINWEDNPRRSPFGYKW